MTTRKAAGPFGDMSPDEFRKHGHAMVEWIARFMENAERYPVLARVAPGDILKALPKSEEKAPSEPAAPGKKLHIKTLEINNVTVTAKLLPIPGKSDAVTFKIAPIKMTDLGSDNKLDMTALTGKILEAIAEGVAKQGSDLLPSDVTGPIKSGLGKTGGLLQGAGETGKKIGEGVFGIFKKKDANSK